MQVRVIDKKDEMYDFIGDVHMFDSERKVWVYFNDVENVFVYDESQLEPVIKKDVL